jgi:hypothetical protein
MDSIKRLLAVMGTIVALMALAPVASAGAHQGFYLEKTCEDRASEPLGYICTVTHSDFKWIPAGTDIRYPSQNGDGSVVQASIEIGNGSTHGACTWDEDPGAQDPLANCVFSAGTGRLTELNLDVDVFVTDEDVWIWSGTYWFGR